MSRLNVYLPDELAARAKREGLNISALTREAVSAELGRREVGAWLAGVPTGLAPEIPHEAALAALDEAREDMGAGGGA